MLRNLNFFLLKVKKEEGYQTTYHSFEEAQLERVQYIEWCNCKRIYGAIGYIKPQQAEE